ncbi:MAG: lytic murein transglycosylase, partial [Neisseriaceae bacterium]|nr:lytic murein transglycosylase [Neisseriaceae bacterium]
MKKRTLSLLTALILFQAACSSQTAVPSETQEQTAEITPPAPIALTPCNDEMCFMQRSAHIVSQDAWTDFFSQVEYKDNIIEIITRPATSRPWYRFGADNASAKRIADGVAFYQQNQSVALNAEQNYG